MSKRVELESMFPLDHRLSPDEHVKGRRRADEAALAKYGVGFGTPGLTMKDLGIHDGKCVSFFTFEAEMSDLPGRKDDSGKLPWSLLPWLAAEAVVKVLQFGAKKYAPENWRLVEHAQDRYWDAAIRHLLAWKRGEKNDPESGLPHLAHAGCCVLFLLELDK